MCVLLIHSRVPEIAARTNAPQVQVRASRDSSVIRFSFDAMPSRRRSIIATVPNTVQIAITCTVSMVGKAHDEEAIQSPTGESSIFSQRGCKSIELPQVGT